MKPEEIPPILDKCGREIEVGDLLKMFHFTGQRQKKYYMYKLVYKNEGYFRCAHCDGDLPEYGMHGFDARVLRDSDFEIIASNNYAKLERPTTARKASWTASAKKSREAARRRKPIDTQPEARK